MTNETPRSDQKAAAGSLRSLVQALDKLVEDQTSFLHLSLPDSTVAQIQKSFTINPLAAAADPGRSYKKIP